MSASVLLPLPDRDFDVTDVSVPWRALTAAGHRVVFATERGGAPPACDPLTISGAVFNLFGAAPSVRDAYAELEAAPEFRSPIAWDAIEPAACDALWLPGGHAPGMRQYLESQTLRDRVARFWELERPVAAICHGVLVLARTKHPSTGRSLIFDKRTTCLPKFAERSAYLSTAWKLGRRFRTYDAYVQDEVSAALGDPRSQFERGPLILDFRRIVAANPRTALVVEDGHYLSGRWPGDAKPLAERLIARLEARRARCAS